MDLEERALAFARSWLGVEEDPRGSNRGEMVDLFNREARVPLGSPWCCSFVITCYRHAALHAGVEMPLPLTGSCSALYHWAVNTRHLVPLTVPPCPGDIGLVPGGPSGFHHAVMIEAVQSPFTLRTIEGNTNEDGSAEGYGVFRRERDGLRLAIVRPLMRESK